MTAARTRRAVLLAGGAAVLAACTAKPAAGPGTRPDVPIRLATRWTGKPDGPLPSAGDEGVPLQLRLTGSSVPPRISGGALVGDLPAQGRSAAYLLQDLGGRVNRIGARFGFGPGDPAGAVALVAVTSFSAPAGHCHMVFGPRWWIAGVVADSQVVELTTVRYRSPLPQDGRALTADVWFHGATARVAAPDGTRRTLTDPRFGGPDGVLACWEFFKDDGGSAAVKFYETWAG